MLAFLLSEDIFTWYLNDELFVSVLLPCNMSENESIPKHMHSKQHFYYFYCSSSNSLQGLPSICVNFHIKPSVFLWHALHYWLFYWQLPGHEPHFIVTSIFWKRTIVSCSWLFLYLKIKKNLIQWIMLPHDVVHVCSFFYCFLCIASLQGQPIEKVFFFIFVGPRSLLWRHWLLLFWILCDCHHGF